MRIAILGGSFDPIHLGHLQIAKTALKKLAIDEVWFMPTFSTPLKLSLIHILFLWYNTYQWN